MPKSMLRKSLLAERAAISPAFRGAASAAISLHLRTMIDAEGIEQILGFWPYRGEPDLTDLWSQQALENEVGLPAVLPDSGAMVFRRFTSDHTLVENRYGILEPPTESPAMEVREGALLVVPCLAADHHGIRLGYGGGYYDRFLATCPQILKVGVLFHKFLLPQVPFEQHDQLLDAVVTEQGWIRCGSVA